MMGIRDWQMFVVSLYLEMDVIHQGQEKRVEVPQKKCKDASQLPLQSNAWVVILQGSDGFKQRGTKHPKQRHHNFYLRDQESLGYLCRQYHLVGHHLLTPRAIQLHFLFASSSVSPQLAV